MVDKIKYWCLKKVEQKYGFQKYKKAFTEINNDLSQQYTEKVKVTKLYELKLRNQHCFQALFTEKAIKKLIRGGGFKNLRFWGGLLNTSPTPRAIGESRMAGWG